VKKSVRRKKEGLVIPKRKKSKSDELQDRKQKLRD